MGKSTVLSELTPSSIDSDDNNHKLFLVECLTDNELKLENTESESTVTRCTKCGFPLEYDKDNDSKVENVTCYICRRENILGNVLISSYILSGLIFILGIVGVFFRVISIDFCLMIGCLLIIILLFFGRFLEEAVFFGISKREQLLASLYRFSISAELQNFDNALTLLHKIESYDEEILRSILQVTAFQPVNLPITWFEDLGESFDLKPGQVVGLVSNVLNEEQETNYVNSLLEKAAPRGLSLLLEIFLKTDNQFGLKLIGQRLDEVSNNVSIKDEIVDDYYIHSNIYSEVFAKLSNQNIQAKFDEFLLDYKEPKVPTIDVIESGKNIIQRNPLLRYLVRILFYILLAFLLGFVYQLLD